MKEILFVTTNQGKVASLQRVFDTAKLPITVKACPLNLVEIQADTALEVARDKALDAYTQLRQPLVVDDSEFRITALNGFPGPFQKYITHMLGPEGIVRLMKGYEDRRAYFISNLIFVDEDGSMHEFSDDPFHVTIVKTYDPTVPKYDWGPLGTICIMEGADKVLSALSRTERAALDQARSGTDAYEKFCAWYKNNEK